MGIVGTRKNHCTLEQCQQHLSFSFALVSSLSFKWKKWFGREAELFCKMHLESNICVRYKKIRVRKMSQQFVCILSGCPWEHNFERYFVSNTPKYYVLVNVHSSFERARTLQHARSIFPRATSILLLLSFSRTGIFSVIETACMVARWSSVSGGFGGVAALNGRLPFAVRYFKIDLLFFALPCHISRMPAPIMYHFVWLRRQAMRWCEMKFPARSKVERKTLNVNITCEAWLTIRYILYVYNVHAYNISPICRYITNDHYGRIQYTACNTLYIE